MNPFFLPNEQPKSEIPDVAFARFDQCEPLDLDDADKAVFIFSAVSSRGFDKDLVPLNLSNYWNHYRDAYWQAIRDARGEQSSENDRLHNDQRVWERFWENYWQALFDGRFFPPFFRPFDPFDPFEPMPLLRYEITVRGRDAAWFPRLRGFSNDESTWFRFRTTTRESGLPADVYTNLFGEPQHVNVEVEPAGDEIQRRFSSIFDMDTWPKASKPDIRGALAKTITTKANFLAAFDIGQGSASALLDDNFTPYLYHDLGAGVTRNKHTTPCPLKFCWCNNPPIVLSHWDSDHWAGALKDTNSLSATWIAPEQSIGPTHTAFANRILRSGGTLHIWPPALGPIVFSNRHGQTLNLGRCNGTNRNGSCLALRVDEPNNGNPRQWLLTGDAGYHQLPFSLPRDPAALVVPHHGAKMSGTHKIPHKPAHYARLLFSFGPGNAHGYTSVRHPTQHSVNEHNANGWDLGAWMSDPRPGGRIAGGHVLATAQHRTTHLNGCVAGWTVAPAPTPGTAFCATGACTTSLDQS